MKMSTIERFWQHVDIPTDQDPDKCWEWLAKKTLGGYGLFADADGKFILAHRFIFKNHYKTDLDSQECVCHSCDNPSCVNPKHLWKGTHADNVRDKVQKGRQLKGEDIKQSILTENDVLEIRKIYPNKTMRELSVMFNVSSAAICRVVNRKSWKHI